MKKLLKKSLILSVLFASSSGHAGNRLICTWSGSSNGCFFKNMQLYNQRIVSDMHCAPTAAAMGLSALTYGGKSYYVGDSDSESSAFWTMTNFINKSEQDRIVNFAKIMKTSAVNGTSGRNIKKFRNRYRDFPGATKSLATASDVDITNSFLKSKILQSEVDILDYGHYKEKCTGIGASKMCVYDRNGGHVITVNGYYYDENNATTITFNNPWDAVQTPLITHGMQFKIIASLLICQI